MTPEIVRAAGQALSDEVGSPVSFDSVQKLDSPHVVFRASVEGTEIVDSVVVKRVTDRKFDITDGDVSGRLLNEWACLEFLGNIASRPPVAPRLLAADRHSSLIVIEDLGHGDTLESILLASAAGDSADLSSACGRLLGELHAQTAGHEDAFLAVQRRLGTNSPSSDSTVDLRERFGVFQESLETLGIEPHSGFWDELTRVEELVHDPGPFRALIHADAGPQNFLVVAGDPRLIDFEFGIYRHALSDVVGARLGFPQTMAAMRVPESYADVFESAHRQAGAETMRAMLDDDLYLQHRDAAMAHWALNRWAGLWRGGVGEIVADAAGDSPSESPGSLGRMMVLWQSYLDASAASCSTGAIASTVEAFVATLLGIWPDFDEVGVYPGLEE